jgi:hypothetical protein
LEKEKMDSWALDKKIMEDNEVQFQKEMLRRQAELEKKKVQTTEGPAHKIVNVSVHELECAC